MKRSAFSESNNLRRSQRIVAQCSGRKDLEYLNDIRDTVEGYDEKQRTAHYRPIWVRQIRADKVKYRRSQARGIAVQMRMAVERRLYETVNLN